MESFANQPPGSHFVLRNQFLKMAANFSEKSGIVLCRTSWGTWGQTIDDVQIEVNVPSGTKGKDVKCTIQPREISLSVHGESVFKARRYATLNGR